MNAYLRDQLLQLAEKTEATAAEHEAQAEKFREVGDLTSAIWWSGLADRSRNRAARCRAEAGMMSDSMIVIKG